MVVQTASEATADFRGQLEPGMQHLLRGEDMFRRVSARPRRLWRMSVQGCAWARWHSRMRMMQEQPRIHPGPSLHSSRGAGLPFYTQKKGCRSRIDWGRLRRFVTSADIDVVRASMCQERQWGRPPGLIMIIMIFSHAIHSRVVLRLCW